MIFVAKEVFEKLLFRRYFEVVSRKILFNDVILMQTCFCVKKQPAALFSSVSQAKLGGNVENCLLHLVGSTMWQVFLGHSRF